MSRNSAKHEEPWQEFYGPNLGYLMDLYEQYKNDPESVDNETRQWFEQYGAPLEEKRHINGAAPAVTSGKPDASLVSKIAAAVKLAENIRIHGHLSADMNPLQEPSDVSSFLQISEYGLTEADLEQLPVDIICPDAPDHITNGLEAINHLKDMHTKSIAFEFDHVHDVDEHRWLNRQVESGEIYSSLSGEKRRKLLQSLTEVESFEQFLHKTFVGQKRFSIEGLDTLVPMLDGFAQSSIQSGARNVMIGMAHRGRLSVLAHVLGKPYDLIFSEFQHAPSENLVPSEGSVNINYGWTGDVKYHLGARKRIEQDQFDAKITLANNPSHLEFVNPVVEGYARAAQEDRSQAGFPQQDTSKSVAVLIHGDAAFPGEGIVTETLNMSRIKGYQTGGTLHIIANNQLGFTTDTHDSRSTTYASDPAKGFEIPIVHVNADDPESCMAAIQLAYEYRNRFNKDFVIDLIGYRRFGHNEMDEPAATQPQLYEIIRKHPTVRESYSQSLMKEGLLTEEEVNELQKEVNNKLREQYDKVSEYAKTNTVAKIVIPDEVEKRLPVIETGYDASQLKQINEELLTWPEGFSVFPKLQKILERRKGSFEENGKIDWPHAETLAFASIVSDGTPVRLTGQDSQRGTFAQRHIVLHDYKNGDIYSPLHTLSTAKASFAVHNSPLSEASIVGFEYGYNVQAADTLVLWEAQFGDFANAAQVLFDQFISAGRAKWGQKSGMVLLLPHGYEGQGPEHSSARLERFLALSAENNWNVAYLSSSAQYFHLLRRQAAILGSEEVRPLVLMTPKSLLRNQNVASAPEEFSNNRFHAVLEEPKTGKTADKVTRLIFATGKMAMDLHEAVDEEQTDWLHIVRIEELYPFPEQEIKDILARYKNVKEFKWVQEEPENMGAWNYLQPLLRKIAPASVETSYIGRRRRSSPSEGDPTAHKAEQSRIINEALSGKE
ncbi:2-oxoglutarate dehydrogenase E1 component [Bacillus piscicola]|uniref:2-oxoglutarate dehydrogenase E1 component n=1 Tax=Bacillus piscicola TaxID=1632684 RepID=UPI001F0943B7|nr:2-oxoglutarate dehydrogenase E1 component [Bacillus piscicola]